MQPFSYAKRLTAEGLGTALLLAIVIGSGIMAQTLAGGNMAVALLGNTLAIGAGLVVLIVVFGPVSGAHFNPLVTLAFAFRREISVGAALGYIVAQFAGAILGVFAAHAMFGQAILQVSTRLRDGPGLVFAEAVAAFGLIGTIFGAMKFRHDFTPVAVGLYIFSACWFTASASFVNPTVTVARALSDSFAGIAPHSVLPFIAGQCAGTLAGVAVFGWLLSTKAKPSEVVNEPGHLS